METNRNKPAEPYPIGEPENQLTVRNVLQGVWSVARIAVMFVSSLMIVAAIALAVYGYVDSHYISPPGKEGDPAREIIISKGMSLNKISILLEDSGLIRNAKVFKYYVDFSGYGSRVKAGTYVLDGNMTLHQIMEKLAEGEPPRPVTTFTIVEGSTIEQAAAQLQKQNILADTAKFLALCQSGESFLKDYPFVREANAAAGSGQRYYLLEGYLFPAKYEIYVGATEEEIIGKMLKKADSVMSDAYMARAKELGLTVDQVLSLASMIEKEGKPDDFAKVSAVFHNRLKQDMKFESDVTVAYAVKKSGFNLTTEDLESDSPYNTRKFKGFPLGPICNPGAKAIYAALYPDQQYIGAKYLFFYVIDPNTGETEFYKTNKELENAKKKYKKVWDEYYKNSEN